jgi:hypothetical protein
VVAGQFRFMGYESNAVAKSIRAGEVGDGAEYAFVNASVRPFVVTMASPSSRNELAGSAATAPAASGNRAVKSLP